MTLQPLTAAHWPQVRAIYEQGLATGNTTFQTEAPNWDDWDRGHLPHSRLVAQHAAGIIVPFQIINTLPLVNH